MLAHIAGLADQLIQTLLPDHAPAVGVDIRPMIDPGRGALQQHAIPHRLAAASGPTTRCKSRAKNRNTIFPGAASNTAFSGSTDHDPANAQ